MKRIAISLSGALLLVAGCSGKNEEQRIENVIRGQLAASGTVTQVEMTKGSDGEYTGFAIVRTPDGHEARLNCATHHNGSAFHAVCGQVIDQALIDQVEASIRQQVTARGLTASQVEMARQDDDHIAGHAIVRDASGNEGRLDCVSARDASNGRFNLHCDAAEGAPAPAAPPADPAQPVEEDQAPAQDEGR